jgi:hypothetical protein
LLQAIEDKFIELIEVPCLSLDIEFYASIIKVQDCITHVERYMDLSTISPESFITLKKLAWMSVLLNNRKRNIPLTPVNLFAKMQDYLHENKDSISIVDLKKDINFHALTSDILEIPVMNDVFDTDTYNLKRKVYYENVHNTSAEHCGVHNNENIKRDVGLIIALANADLYREESYILLPTVLVIVHMKQKYDKLGKPEGSCVKGQRVECTMNRDGYLLALIEQLGYMNRFHDKPDKIKKYIDRAKYCMEWYNKGDLTTDADSKGNDRPPSGEAMADGGNRKYKRTKKKRKTKRRPTKRRKSKKNVDNIY